MKYYSYDCYDEDHPDKGYIVTVSEDEIIREFWDFWYEKMCKKFGKEVVDRDYSRQECIDDWVITYWAWEVDV